MDKCDHKGTCLVLHEALAVYLQQYIWLCLCVTGGVGSVSTYDYVCGVTGGVGSVSSAVS